MRHLATLAAVLALSAAASAETPEEAQTKARATIETKTVTMKFENAPLGDVVKWLKDETGLDIVPMPRVAQAIKDGTITVDVNLHEVNLATALRLTLANLGLTYDVRLGKLFILAEDDARETVTQIWDIRSLATAIRDFAGPALGLPEPDDGGTI